MGIIKTKGIILSEHNMGDFDKMLTILTPRHAAKFHVLPKEQEGLKVLFLLVANFYVLESIYYIKEQIHIILIHVRLLRFFIIFEWI